MYFPAKQRMNGLMTVVAKDQLSGGLRGTEKDQFLSQKTVIMDPGWINNL